MGTRATYHLSAGHYDNHRVCFYIHWDGYLKGAAFYFLHMHQLKNDRGGYAGRFIRANELAEFTPSHDTHGDTEYRYDLDRAGILTAYERVNWDPAQWNIVYTGLWYDFVNQYLQDSHEKLYLFKDYTYQSCGSVMSLHEALALLDRKLETIKTSRDEGNLEKAQSYEKEAAHLQEQINALFTEQV